MKNVALKYFQSVLNFCCGRIGMKNGDLGTP